MKNSEILQIDELKQFTTLSNVQCDFFAEACKVALQNQGHQPPTILKVVGDTEKEFLLQWDFLELTYGWQEIRDIVENGSIAIAIFLIDKISEYKVVQQSIIGTGFDYWLSLKEEHPDYDAENFLNARLEISGINKSSLGVINQRVRDKLKQVGVTDYLEIPAYVVVTEFSRPLSKIIKKMSLVQSIHQEAMQKAFEAFEAQKSGKYQDYLSLTKQAFEKEKEAAWLLFTKTDKEPTRSILFRSAAQLAFNSGQMREAEQLIAAALSGNPPVEIRRELRFLLKEVLATFDVVA